ncbi:TonB-dependent siderophore receptor [Paracidovorax valerianellae]|uniref:Iron complex outermembrane recepter protein n=1 Tax=Paracidovorax valerianellae TaxID=187868 RepID=A0A1G6PPE2_9BURK|nr:TonB-dependent siderophore receptor [Paracidovorax valerianellae]MDA8444925.1 TonB-dependent siderophore receptor [Paracidovorax valerianellae]SDC81366.1 iron complex outermembrane recepter protein [Paracidovorax valerianellae]
MVHTRSDAAHSPARATAFLRPSLARSPARTLCRCALTPLALCLSQAAMAQASADATPQLQEVRINASTEKDVGFAPAEAQTAGKAPMRRLETPQSISVVTREQMESRQITNMQQALQTVAGVSPVNFGRRGFDDINIRGFRSTESILIDGLVQSPGMWTRLTPYGYERFEVLKGAASVLYGQVQPGGIVNAVSKRPKRDALSEVGVEVGSFGQRTLQADINRPLNESGKAAFRINAQVSSSDDPTDFVYRRDRWIAPSLSLDLGPQTDLVLFATYSQSNWLRQQGVTPYGTVLPNRNGPVRTTLYTGDPSFGGYDIESTSVGYALEHRISPQLTLRQNVRYESEKGNGNFVSNLALQANQRLQNRQATRQYLDDDMLATDTSLLSQFAALGVQHRLVTGLDARTSHSWQGQRRCTIGALDVFNPAYGVSTACPTAYTSNAPEKLSVMGLYAQDQIKFNPQWTALVGLRRDWSNNQIDDRLANRQTRQKDSATTLSAGLVYEFTPGWAAYTSYGESFLPVAGTNFGGSPFVPETGKQWEAGLKYEAPNGGLTGSLALFDLKRRNVTTADAANTGFNVQTGEQRARGLELEVGAELLRSLKLTGAYTYTDTKVTSDSNAAIVGLPLNLTPRHTLALWATYKLPQMPQITLGAGARYVSEQVGSYPFTLPAYTVADLSIGYAGSNYRITAGVKNVFDKAYYDGAINANVVSPAMPRSFNVGLTYFF